LTPQLNNRNVVTPLSFQRPRESSFFNILLVSLMNRDLRAAFLISAEREQGNGETEWLSMVVKTVRLERNMTKTLDHFWAGYGDGTRVGVQDGSSTSRLFLKMRGSP
jgi:hypothetical protein